MQILSLLIVVSGLLMLWGCTPYSFHAPSIDATPAPLLATLQLPLSFMTPLSVALTPRPTFNITQIMTPFQTSPATVLLPAPTCYSQAQRGLICLGQVMNQGLQSLRDVRLLVRSGSQTRTVSTEQRIIPSGTTAPYRVQFAAVTSTISATLDSYTLSDAPLPAVTLSHERGIYRPDNIGYGFYDYRASLIVGDHSITSPWQVTVTLLDEEQRVVGYRVLDSTAPLLADRTYPIHLEIIPQVTAERYFIQAIFSTR